MKAPRRLDFVAPLPTFIVIFQPIHTKPSQIISEFSRRITLSIRENPMKIRAVVFEFFARRQTDRQTDAAEDFVL